MKKLFLMLLALFLFSGCSDYKELTNIAIVSGLSIDKTNKGYKISVLVANSRNSSENNTEATAGNSVYEVESDTIATGMQKLDSVLPKKIYLGHLGVVVIDEQVAKDGISNIADYFFRNPETTKRFYLIMAKNDEKASDVLKILSPLESFPFQNIRLNIENSSASGALSHNITFSKFIQMYLKKGADPILPTITINGDVEKGSSTEALQTSDISFYIEVKGIAIFKDDKFVDYATRNESRGINLAIGNVTDAVINIKNNVIVNVSDVKTKKKVKFINNKPVFYITVTGIGDIQEVNSNINLHNSENINIIKKDTEKEMKKLIFKGIKKIKKSKSDILALGNLLYKKNPKFYNSIDWYDYLDSAQIKVKVDLKIQNKGSIKQAIKAAKK